ncbi:MAG: ABC transporter permease [Candidatus Coatesbacteria bacterium]|nr:ABC transporter permease [Candidatus Coatesbacteria bacterium]
MKTILNLMRKEFIQFKRDKRMFLLSFFAPVFQLLILAYAVNLDVKSIQTIVCDMDKSEKSRALLSEFFSSGYFDCIGYTDKLNDVDKHLNNNNASIAIIILSGFSNNLLSKKQAKLQLIIDGSDSNAASIGLSYATIIITRFSRKISAEYKNAGKNFMEKGFTFSPEFRIWFNPELKSKDFMIPGVLALLLMVMTMILTSLAIVKEKESGTMEQLIVTPIKPYHIILGKLLPFAVIGLIDVILVIFVARFWFDIPLKGSFSLLLLLCCIFLMTTLGLGLLISTFSKNQQQAMITAIFFFMVPMVFLSGFVFPIENMPDIIQYITYLFPLRYFFVIIRGLFLKGAGIAELWDETVALIVIGIVILSLSIARFHKKLE